MLLSDSAACGSKGGDASSSCSPPASPGSSPVAFPGVARVESLHFSSIRELVVDINDHFRNQLMEFHQREFESLHQVPSDPALSAVGGSVAPSPATNTGYQTATKKNKLVRKARLKVVTFNGNSWSTIKGYLLSCSSSVVCVQEHKLTPDEIVDAFLWSKSHGWQAFFGEAEKTAKGGRSVGRCCGPGMGLFASLDSRVLRRPDQAHLAFQDGGGGCVRGGAWTCVCYFLLLLYQPLR